LISLAGRIRQAILADQLDEFARELLAHLDQKDLSEPSDIIQPE
jgi:hypothetical protein